MPLKFSAGTPVAKLGSSLPLFGSVTDSRLLRVMAVVALALFVWGELLHLVPATVAVWQELRRSGSACGGATPTRRKRASGKRPQE
jgi:hypothetical protein